MKKFLKLTNFEFNRMSKMLFVLMGFVLLFQMIGVVYVVSEYKNRLNDLITDGQMSQAQALEQMGPLSFEMVMYNMFFLGPIFISVGAILFYIFLIWYRDWFGKNTFIYRLLMLPTERLNIFFSKLIAIFIATLALATFQFVALVLERALFDAMLSEMFRADMSLRMLMEGYPVTYMILPKSIDGFFIMYGIGLVSVMVVFTGILMERSFRIKGIILGAIYFVLSLALVVLPGILNYEVLSRAYLYDGELLAIMGVLLVIVAAVSIMVSRKLLNDRIRV
ncbi:hypothetical protein ACTWQB_10330 [Piscibacillus sp. B03]|uniref:hypothetical protein n=1 Tax=Piscibacillus sp. B03 TaxID=3457430 RepID=UPI003FCDAAF3